MINIIWLGVILLSLHPTTAYTEEIYYNAPANLCYRYGVNTIRLIVEFLNVPYGYYPYRIYNVNNEIYFGDINNSTQSIEIETQRWVSFEIFVDIKKKYGSPCSRTLITVQKKNDCRFNSTPRIYVNFRNKCFEDTYDVQINCNGIDDRYHCSHHKHKNLKTTSHWWYHYNRDDTKIGGASLTSAYRSHYSLTLELFDYNSYVISSTKNKGRLFSSNSENITYPDNTVTDHSVFVETFSDSNLIEFSCMEYVGPNTSSVEVAIIDTSMKKIKPQNTREIKRYDIVNSTDILCCLIFEVSVVKSTGYIKRRVEKKTRFVYEPRSITKHKSDEAVKAFAQDNSDYSTSFITITMLIVGILVLIGILVLLAVFMFMRFKKLKKTNESPPTVEINTYVCSNNILYAELNLTQACRQTVVQEESPYAEVAGVVTLF